MWVRRAAIRPVPLYAQVHPRALIEVEEQLDGDDDTARAHLDAAYSRFDDVQPALAALVQRTLNRRLDDTALALGYFLGIALWLAFEETFRDALDTVTPTALEGVEQALRLDEQIRLSDPAEAVDSDDVVAMEQPHVLSFVHEHVNAALEASAATVEVDDVHQVYRMLLVEILALSYAVRPPSSWALASTEITA